MYWDRNLGVTMQIGEVAGIVPRVFASVCEFGIGIY